MNLKPKQLAELIKSAYREGYDDYETQCAPMKDFDSCWEDSFAKREHDKLMKLYHESRKR